MSTQPSSDNAQTPFKGYTYNDLQLTREQVDELYLKSQRMRELLEAPGMEAYDNYAL